MHYREHPALRESSHWPLTADRPCPLHMSALPPLLALHPVPPPPPQARSAILWGDASVARFAARTAAAAVHRGVIVAVIDGAMAFDVTAIAADAQARRVSPERLPPTDPHRSSLHLPSGGDLAVRTARSPISLTAGGISHPVGPGTTFFDENVPFKDAFLLFQRVLGKIAALCKGGPLLLVAQALDGYRTRRISFVRELVKAVELGIRVYTVEGRRHVQLVKPRRPGQSWASPASQHPDSRR